MSWTLRVQDGFEAAHALRSYKGAPETVHGHSWRVEVELLAEELDDEGMGFDFVEVRGHLRSVAARFDHGDINAMPPFDVLTPTTELLAKYFYDEMARRMPDSGLVAITVWEGPHCSATYRP